MAKNKIKNSTEVRNNTAWNFLSHSKCIKKVQTSAADAQFASLDPPGYALVPGPATVLPFGEVLAVAAFRCNVQEASGISCLSEKTGKGFTFSADGYTFQYTDLPG